MEFPRVTYSDWRRRVDEELGEAGFEATLVSRSECGLPIEPLYAADGPLADLLAPAAEPVSSGLQSDDLHGRDRRWSLCPFYGGTDPEVLRRELREDLDGGADGAWLRLGRGRAVHDLEALDRLFADFDPGRLAIVLDAGRDAVAAADLWQSLLDRRGSRLRADLNLGADPLSLLAEGAGDGPDRVATLRRDMASLAMRCDRHLPGARAAVVSTMAYRRAGVDAVGELAAALATVVDYLRSLTAAGMSTAAATAQIGLRLSIGLEIFPEAAKLRAARHLWSQMSTACGVEAVAAAQLHAVTDPGDADPWTDALRSTTQVFAAIIGGADCITGLPRDDADRSAAGPGRRLVRNTQLILAEESFLGRAIDPAGGSYFMEALTEQLSRAAWAEFQRIERRGGMEAALRGGWIAERLTEQIAGQGSPEATR